MAAAGFGDLVAPCPELEPLAEAARHCWRFCDGWHPERWPVYQALYPVADWHQLIDLMAEIKGHL